MRAPARLIVLLGAVVVVLLGQGAPSLAQSAATGPSDVTGTLVRTVADDFAARSSVSGVGVQSETGSAGFVPLVGADARDLARLLGSRVRARGTVVGGGALRVAPSDVTRATSPAPSPAPPLDPTGQDGAGSVAPAPQDIRLLAVTVRFADSSAVPVQNATLRDRLFTGGGSVAAFYDDVSAGDWQLSGAVRGPFTVSRSSTSCDYSTWGRSALLSAQAAGEDLSQYTHAMVAWPAQSACRWAGLAQVSGSLSWINTADPGLYVLSHELGHNVGENHASTLSCTDSSGARVPIGDSSRCSTSEYGDPFSTMGRSPRLHHAPALEHLDLLTPTTLPATANARVTLRPTYSSGGMRELRIPRPDGTWLSVEYRRPTGLFDAFAAGDPVVNGVTVRIDRGPERTTHLIDANPATSTFSDAPLAVGQSLRDPASGATIRLLSRTDDAAEVAVDQVTTGRELPEWATSIQTFRPSSTRWVPDASLVTG